MARLGYGELQGIKRNILADLYGSAEEALELRKTSISAQNRAYVMEPLQELINQLPENLFNKESRYHLFISYKPVEVEDRAQYTDDSESDQFRVNQVWESRLESSYAINPATNYYGNPHTQPTNLDPRLHEEAAALCEDILTLRIEKNELRKFIQDTTDKYTGSKQLREVWPTTLHRFLPAEPPPKPRVPRTKKEKVISPDPVAPTFIKQRLTTNLLEKD